MEVMMNTIVQRMHPFQHLMLLPHFAALSPEDLRLRFGMQMNGALLEKYVERIDFSNDAIFGIFNEDPALLGMVHLAINPEGVFAEIGLSVLPQCRGIGYGTALLKMAALHAANCGIHTLYMRCLAENSVMIHLAQKVGLRVFMEPGERGLYRWLVDSHMGTSNQELITGQVALVDYTVTQVRSPIPKVTPEAVQP
jgi:RimJ/RimL family protein N-acetyltransferase